MSDDNQATRPPKWTEIEHLPEWDEEFYHVYTAKKHGKWVMLKTLKPELRDKPEFREMMEKEFEVRYNLAHPNIVMINDLEEVPGLGMCIIFDDVYGDSLGKLLDKDTIDNDILNQIINQLVQAMEYIQTKHIVHYPITFDRIIFTENIHNLKIIDVGFDQKNHLRPADISEDIYNFGVILNRVLDAMPENHPKLRSIASRCTNPNPEKRFRDVQALKSALNNNSNNKLYITIIVFLALMIVLLVWLNSPYRPLKRGEQALPMTLIEQIFMPEQQP